MKISLIVAAAANRVIGADGGLPWHLPNDFRYFKRVTMGKPLVMGRLTWDSFEGALPGRQNIVLTRRPGFVAAGATVVSSPAAAIAAARDAEELMVIGGRQVYALFLDTADRIYLTQVETVAEGDTIFPELDPADWDLVWSEAHPADERHAYAYTFKVFDRS